MEMGQSMMDDTIATIRTSGQMSDLYRERPAQFG